MKTRTTVVESVVAAALTALIAPALGQNGASGYIERMRLDDATTARVSSWDRSGGNMDFLEPKPGDRFVLADIRGPGCIRHIYWAYICEDPAARESLFRNLIIRMYWDGEKTPSVECPIGDFFLVSNGVVRPVNALDFVINPGMGRDRATSYGLNCYLPMAFAKRALIEVTYDAEPGSTPPGGFWYHIDHETYSKEPAWMRTVGRFHAQFRRSSPTKAVDLKGKNLDGKENFVILDAVGTGHVAGYMLSVDNLVGSWWGEGDDMVVVDGSPWPPAYHGTGSEEIFGGGACPDTEYSGPYTGFHLVENRDKDPWFGKNAMYRFFVRDPIRFRKSIQISIEHGHANDLANDYSSVAYWYQREPHAAFPPLPDRLGRMPNHTYPPGPGDIPDAIEAEAQVGAAKTGGNAPTAIRFAGKWSKGRFLWYIGKGPGDYLSFPISVPTDGWYALLAWMTRATDFGIVELYVDGKRVGEPFDGYNGEGGYGPTHVIRADGVPFGDVALTAGDHTLEFRLTGKGEKAIGYMIGVDCVVLKRPSP